MLDLNFEKLCFPRNWREAPLGDPSLRSQWCIISRRSQHHSQPKDIFSDVQFGDERELRHQWSADRQVAWYNGCNA
jgi:hypothetical protein